MWDMRVFVTGATGFIGSAIVVELISRGHEVIGLARSDAAAAHLESVGATPHRGSIENPASLRQGAALADAAAHTAYFHQLTHAGVATRLRVAFGGSPRRVVPRFLQATTATDRVAIATIGQALGPGRPFVSTFGTLALPAGRTATEDDEVDPRSVGGPRGSSEQVVDDLAQQGVRAMLVRLPPIVHGDGDHGFLPRLIGYARKYGVSSFAGDGSNRWPSVHRLDAARLFVQALEHGQSGARYHGVADEGVPLFDIAAAIGRNLGVPVEAATPAHVRKRFSFLAAFIGTDNPTSSALTSARLGWEATESSLLDDIEHGTYFRERA
jgi:nucleoside-diphosphate-sugar epimerase